MKLIRNILYTLILLTTIKSYSATLVAITDGDWDDPTTWSTGTAPTDWDVVIIPLGITVEVNGVNGTVYANISITVEGELNIDNGQKLRIDCNSMADITGTGVLSGDNGGSKLVVCNVDEYVGTSPVNGPERYGVNPLPIELISFKAEIRNKENIELIWETASETNNDFFSIEKSINGITYELIGTIKGAGNSTTTLPYSFIDKNPFDGTSYYRLKQTDFDGKFAYSSIITVNFTKTENGCVLKVYPNPCTSECNVDLVDCDDDLKPEISVELIDAGGHKVYSKVPVRDEKGAFSFSIDANNNLKPGIYIVKGVSRKENYTKKIIVK